jgi:hypothetical protein
MGQVALEQALDHRGHILQEQQAYTAHVKMRTNTTHAADKKTITQVGAMAGYI